MKLNFTLLFLLAFILSVPAGAQLGIWANAKNFIGTELMYDMSLTHDGMYVYVLGSGAVPASGSGSPGPYSFFIGKYDTSGILVKTIMPKALGSGFESEAYSMATDPQANYYITGYFSSKIQIGKQTLSGNGGAGADYFLARFDAKDSARWIKGLVTSSGNSITGSSLDVDDSGYIYVVGNYSGTIKIGGKSLKSKSGSYSTFFAKYDSTGKVIWATSFGNYPVGSLNTVTNVMVEKHTPSPSVYLCGSFSSKQSIGSFTLTTTGSDDIMVLKYDASGILHNIATYGGKSSDVPFRLKMSSHGKLVLGGTFMGTTSIGGIALTSKGSQDIFTAMLDTSLKVKWAASIGGTDYEVPGMAAFDSFDNVFVTGEMRSSPTWFGKDTIGVSGFSNAYLAKYDSSGKLLGFSRSSSTNLSSSYISYQSGFGIVADSAADIYTSGVLSGHATFGDTNNIIHANGANKIDVFITKMKDTTQRCRYFKALAFTTKNASCHGMADGAASISLTGGLMPYTYSWPHDPALKSYAATALPAGTYKVKVTDNLGCITIDSATLTEPSALVLTGTVQNASGSTPGNIKLNVSGGTPPYKYTWKNGDTTSHPDSLVAGTYPVTVKDANGCTMLDSFTVSLSSGIASAVLPYSELKIMPNPAHEMIRLQTGGPVETLAVYDLTGRLCYKALSITGDAIVNIGSWPAGLYKVIATGRQGDQWQGTFIKN